MTLDTHDKNDTDLDELVQFDMNLFFSNEVMTSLREKVEISTLSDLHNLVSDALNTFVHLGNLAKDDTRFFVREHENGELRRMRFPFETE